VKAKVIVSTPAELEAAARLYEESERIEPRAESAHYDARNRRVVIRLRKGAAVTIPIEWIHEVAGATPRQLAEVRASRFGSAIEWESLDMHISVKGLMRDLVGITGAASVLGSEGGKAKTKVKAAAARTNGKRGGRPRKPAA
jgi:hypothetical protein